MKRWYVFAAALALLVAMPLQAYAAVKVVVDPGHGGHDPGAIGVNGLRESAVNTDISSKLRDELLRRGYDVVMTKEAEDVFLPLAERTEIARSSGADLFVSIHANDYPSSGVQGSMVLYYDAAYPQWQYPASPEMRELSPESRKLAQHVLDAMVSVAGTVNKGLMPSSVYVVRTGNIPSILVETGFLSNADEAARLADPAFRERLAYGIADGIQSYTPPVFADLRGHWAAEAVLQAKARGILEGEDGRFYPDRALTRAEFLAVMDRMFNFAALPDEADAASRGKDADSPDAKSGKEDDAGENGVTDAVYAPADNSAPAPDTTAYRDLKPSHWVYEVMGKAAKLGLVYGYEDGTARPDRAISRAEVAVLFDRMLTIAKAADRGARSDEAATRTAAFVDVPSGHWSAAAVYRLHSEGLLDGTDVDRFAPDRTMSRAEMAVLAERYYARQGQ